MNNLSTERAKGDSQIIDDDSELVRMISTRLLTEALGGSPEQHLPETARDGILDASQRLAVLIEQQLLRVHSNTSKEYRSSVRSISFNIKTNPALRGHVYGGAVSVSELCNMQSLDMASEQLQLQFKALQNQTLKRCTITQQDGIPTTAYSCPLCKAQESEYRVLAGSRDIGKAETWGSSCNNTGIAVTCRSCGHAWRRDLA